MLRNGDLMLDIRKCMKGQDCFNNFRKRGKEGNRTEISNKVTPGLRMGVTIAFFHRLGKILDFKLQLHNEAINLCLETYFLRVTMWFNFALM